ncbi:hypothetical protein [Streptomyces sp. WAC06614]|uniref:hypothetical protein n=1 Tax=Streptomyces sp. WAC06614 TaxID=2487416 RepID=UPI000F789A61|nr:hypothetical protein [Streptomyces sp. WAC06614]RSS80791.1 hypothetical protein EF918_12490 [Streptomyces sp. WAC06614]
MGIFLGRGSLGEDSAALEGYGAAKRIFVPHGRTVHFYTDGGRGLDLNQTDVWGTLQKAMTATHGDMRPILNTALRGEPGITTTDVASHPSFAGRKILRPGHGDLPSPLLLCTGMPSDCPTLVPCKRRACRKDGCQGFPHECKDNPYWRNPGDLTKLRHSDLCTGLFGRVYSPQGETHWVATSQVVPAGKEARGTWRANWGEEAEAAVAKENLRIIRAHMDKKLPYFVVGSMMFVGDAQGRFDHHGTYGRQARLEQRDATGFVVWRTAAFGAGRLLVAVVDGVRSSVQPCVERMGGAWKVEYGTDVVRPSDRKREAKRAAQKKGEGLPGDEKVGRINELIVAAHAGQYLPFIAAYGVILVGDLGGRFVHHPEYFKKWNEELPDTVTGQLVAVKGQDGKDEIFVEGIPEGTQKTVKECMLRVNPAMARAAVFRVSGADRGAQQEAEDKARLSRYDRYRTSQAGSHQLPGEFAPYLKIATMSPHVSAAVAVASAYRWLAIGDYTVTQLLHSGMHSEEYRKAFSDAAAETSDPRDVDEVWTIMSVRERGTELTLQALHEGSATFLEEVCDEFVAELYPDQVMDALSRGKLVMFHNRVTEEWCILHGASYGPDYADENGNTTGVDTVQFTDFHGVYFSQRWDESSAYGAPAYVIG